MSDKNDLERIVDAVSNNVDKGITIIKKGDKIVIRRREAGDECFVATLVYGDDHAIQIEALRRFRDHVLQQRMSGRIFIWLYYNGVGRISAFLVRRFAPFLIKLIRRVLDQVASRH